MKETLQTPEIKKKGAPIHIIFGRHSATNIDDLKKLDKALEDRLYSAKSGNIFVFIEDASGTEDAGKRCEKLVEQGVLPTVSFLRSIFEIQNHRLPNPENSEDDEKIKMLANISESKCKFVMKELAILDKHFYSGRIRLLWESMPNEKTLLRESERIDEIINLAIVETFLAVKVGNFKGGLEPFKRGTEIIARENIKRNQRLASRIAAVAQDIDTGWVVGYFGANHTALGHILSKEGYTVTRTFSDKIDRQLLWNSQAIAIRHREFYPDKELTEFDWYRLMIGAAIEGNPRYLAKKTGETTSDQVIIRAARSDLAQLTNMESIRQLEREVGQKGFYEAWIDRFVRK